MPAVNRWSPAAERDLAIAIIQSLSVARYDWAKINQLMSDWGYSFTSGSVSQHWTKKILKESKSRLVDGSAATDPEPKTPGKAQKVAKPKTSSGSKRKFKQETFADNEDESPSKKRAVKADPEKARHRERSTTMAASNFDEWMKMGDDEI